MERSNEFIISGILLLAFGFLLPDILTLSFLIGGTPQINGSSLLDASKISVSSVNAECQSQVGTTNPLMATSELITLCTKAALIVKTSYIIMGIGIVVLVYGFYSKKRK